VSTAISVRYSAVRNLGRGPVSYSAVRNLSRGLLVIIKFYKVDENIFGKWSDFNADRLTY